MTLEAPSAQLLFHGAVILLIALLTGIPYGRAILKKQSDEVIFAWRVAHSALTIGAMLLLLLVPIIPLLQIGMALKGWIAGLFVCSGYAFVIALVLGPIVGHRGLSHRGPIAAKIVYAGNGLGAATSLLGTMLLLFAAWQSL